MPQLKRHVGKHMSTRTRRAWKCVFLLSLRCPSGPIAMISLTSTLPTRAHQSDQPGHLGFLEYVFFSDQRKSRNKTSLMCASEKSGKQVNGNKKPKVEGGKKQNVVQIQVALCSNPPALNQRQHPINAVPLGPDVYPCKNVAYRLNFYGRTHLCLQQKKKKKSLECTQVARKLLN